MKTLLTQTEIGHRLGVDRRQVHMWDRRRATNGFPEPVEFRTVGPYTSPVYDWQQVQKWHRRYVPSNGGRKPAKPA